MILDTSFISEFYEAEGAKTSSELFSFLEKENFTTLYTSLGIETTNIYSPPKCEVTSLDDSKKVTAPISLAFKFYFLLAKEFEMKGQLYESQFCFAEAYKVLKPYRTLQKTFKAEYEISEKKKLKNARASTYEARYGEKKAQEIKNKISRSMKKLDASIIERRNESIKKYASNRPASHNKAIAHSLVNKRS